MPNQSRADPASEAKGMMRKGLASGCIRGGRARSPRWPGPRCERPGSDAQCGIDTDRLGASNGVQTSMGLSLGGGTVPYWPARQVFPLSPSKVLPPEGEASRQRLEAGMVQLLSRLRSRGS